MKHRRNVPVLAALALVLVSAIVILISGMPSGKSPRAPRAGRPLEMSPAAGVDGSSPSLVDPSPVPGTTVEGTAEYLLAPPFTGDIQIRGIAVEEGGIPVADALVTCTPEGFAVQPCARAPHLAAHTNGSGEFVLMGLPIASSYSIAARRGPLFGVIVLPDPREEARISLRSLAYESYSLFDRAGAAVNVSGLTLIGGMKSSPFSQTDYPQSRDKSFLLTQFGVDWPVAANCLAYFWPRTFDPTTWQPTLEIHVPGYRAVTCARKILPISDWPVTSRVDLEPEPLPQDSARYVVEWPELAVPAAWITEGGQVPWIELNVNVPDTEFGWQLGPSTRRFVGPVGSRFTLQMHCQQRGETLAYAEERLPDGTILIRPEWPSLGYVSVYWDHQAAALRGGCSMLPKGLTSLRGPQIWPGYARVGPFPIGPMKLIRWWMDNPRVELTDTMTIEITEGHCEAHWK